MPQVHKLPSTPLSTLCVVLLHPSHQARPCSSPLQDFRVCVGVSVRLVVVLLQDCCWSCLLLRLLLLLVFRLHWRLRVLLLLQRQRMQLRRGVLECRKLPATERAASGCMWRTSCRTPIKAADVATSSGDGSGTSGLRSVSVPSVLQQRGWRCCYCYP